MTGFGPVCAGAVGFGGADELALWPVSLRPAIALAVVLATTVIVTRAPVALLDLAAPKDSGSTPGRSLTRCARSNVAVRPTGPQTASPQTTLTHSTRSSTSGASASLTPTPH